MRLDQLMARVLEGPPEDVAILWEGRTYDWGWVRRTAAWLEQALTEAGVPKTAPIAFIPRQRPEAIAAFASLVAGGRSMSMIYSYQSPEAMAAEVRKLRNAALVASQEDWTAPLLAAAADVGAAGVKLSSDGAVELAPGLERVSAPAHRPPPPEPVVEVLTSGTTGLPKRHPITFEALRRCATDAAFQQADLTDGRPGQLTTPLANISGIFSFFILAPRRKPIILQQKYTLESWREHIRTWRPDNAFVNPTMVKQVLDADIPKEDFASLSHFTTGMGPIDPDQRRALEAKYGIPVLPHYGATEFVGTVTRMTLADHEKYGEAKFGSAGRPVPGVTIRVRDPETEAEIPPGDERIGVLEVRKEQIGPDWVRTTDLARIDADGFLYLHGRADGVIVRGGFKIHPAVIEGALLQHPAVQTAAVVGVPDARVGAAPGAALELRPGAPAPSIAELDAFLRQRLPATNIPTQYRFVDALPRTPSEKIRLGEVRALFEPAEGAP
jgi:long-chain acyl-CoA synthetase